jgi:hypothetical protein
MDAIEIGRDRERDLDRWDLLCVRGKKALKLKPNKSIRVSLVLSAALSFCVLLIQAQYLHKSSSRDSPV